MKILFIIAAVIALQACKHPLGVQGEGDIIELRSGVRGQHVEHVRGHQVDGDAYLWYMFKPEQRHWRSRVSAA